MTKVRIKGLDKETEVLRKRILLSVERSKFKKTLVKELAAQARKSEIPPGLAPTTKRFRERVVSNRAIGFSADVSNLILSGQLLNSLKGGFDRVKGMFSISAGGGRHKQYKVKALRNRKAGGGRPAIKKGQIISVGSRETLSSIFEWLSEKRPITKLLDNRDFKLGLERRLVAAIKRFFK